MIKQYALADGKYALLRNEVTFEVKSLRHGEPWPTMDADLIGNNLVHALLNRIDTLEGEVDELYHKALDRCERSVYDAA